MQAQQDGQPGLDGAAKCLEQLGMLLRGEPDGASQTLQPLAGPPGHAQAPLGGPFFPSPDEAVLTSREEAFRDRPLEGPVLTGRDELVMTIKAPDQPMCIPVPVRNRGMLNTEDEILCGTVCDEADAILMSPILARTPSSILQSPPTGMDRATRLLALVQQREDELAQLKLERSQDLSSSQALLQKQHEELAELQAQQLDQRARKLTQEASNSSEGWAAEVERLRSEMMELTAQYEQDIQNVRSLLEQREQDLTEAAARHSEELSQVRELLKDRECELAHLKAQAVMAVAPGPSVDIENLQKSMFSMQAENLHLQSDLHEKKWNLERVQMRAEKSLLDSVQFVKRLASSSSGPHLEDWFDLNSHEFLGMGNYGYVMTCNSKKSGGRVVVKLQSERWVGVVLAEWAHGHEVGVHPHIVEHHEVVMHRDLDGGITRKLKAAFDQGVLAGRQPKFFPNTYFCIAIEYMDRGNVQHLIDKSLLTVEGMAAIAHQVASALAFMHKKKRTHNDIKPENILLCAGPGGDCLLAKLADLGLADHSLDQKRDRALYAYTIWCTCLHREFQRCPSNEEKKVEACAQFSKAMPTQTKEQNLWKALHKVVEGLWLGTDLTMREVEEMKTLQKLKIKSPDSKEAAADLKVCAKHDIGRRQTRNMEKWKLMNIRRPPGPDSADEEEEDEIGNFNAAATWPPSRSSLSRGGNR